MDKNSIREKMRNLYEEILINEAASNIAFQMRHEEPAKARQIVQECLVTHNELATEHKRLKGIFDNL